MKSVWISAPALLMVVACTTNTSSPPVVEEPTSPPPQTAEPAPRPTGTTDTAEVATEAPKPEGTASEPTEGKSPEPSSPAAGTSNPPLGSVSGRVVRFTCPGGEVPLSLRTGCGCDREILNPCKSGGGLPKVEGNVCVFDCPEAVEPPKEFKNAQQACLYECNEKSGWMQMGQCQDYCEREHP